ncbi:MAG TPA: hypothetical protein VGP33_15390 [Chloroflexota bacterium]|nr:hypothetical protein [Chloroflexota bacterium]
MKAGRPLTVIGIVALVVCMAVAAVAVVRGPSAVAPPTAVASVDKGVAHAAMGAVNTQFAVSVTRLQRTATIPGAPALAAGLHYVTLAVTFANQSSAQQRANPDDFQLVDALGVTRSPTFLGAPNAQCPRWPIADLYPNGPGSATPRDAAATQAGRTFGPEPLCFAAGGDPGAALTLIWDPDVSQFFDSPTHIALQ